MDPDESWQHHKLSASWQHGNRRRRRQPPIPCSAANPESPIAPAVPHHPTAAAQLSAVTSAEAARAVPFSHPWAEILPVLVRSSEAEPLNWAQRLENMGFIAGHFSYTFAEETVLSSAGRARRHSV